MLPGADRARSSDGADLAIGSRYVPGGAVPGWPRAPPRCCRSGATATRPRCSACTSATPPPGSGPTGPTILEPDRPRRVRADGYGFQIEMAYEVNKAGGTHRGGADHLRRPRSRGARRCRPTSSSRRWCWSPGGASATGSGRLRRRLTRRAPVDWQTARHAGAGCVGRGGDRGPRRGAARRRTAAATARSTGRRPAA